MTTHAHVAQRNIGWLPRLDERTRESAALVVGGIAFVLAGVPALIVLWREMVPIAGPGSIGAYASTFAGAAALSFVAALLLPKTPAHRLTKEFESARFR